MDESHTEATTPQGTSRSRWPLRLGLATAGLLLLGVTALGWWWRGAAPLEIALTSAAVLIVACPCALALSAPFTLGAALRVLGRNRFYLRSAEVIETLAAADALVFDKTGTLTDGAFAIVSDNPFYAVSGEDGSFKIEKVPDGKYKVMAWHSQYGKKEQEIEVKGGEVKVEFKYDGTEAEPDDNKGELNGLW